MARSCRACLAVKQAPANAPLHPWAWPSQRLHIDFAGPFLDKSFFIVVDAHSKWAEVLEMCQTTTAKTIETLRHLFAIHGIPEQIVPTTGPSSPLLISLGPMASSTPVHHHTTLHQMVRQKTRCRTSCSEATVEAEGTA